MLIRNLSLLLCCLSTVKLNISRKFDPRESITVHFHNKLDKAWFFNFAIFHFSEFKVVGCELCDF